MKFYFDGCSNMDAKGYLCDYKAHRYSARVCKHFGAEEYNFARGGGSNIRLLRNITVDNYDLLDECDLVFIQMSFRNRTEWYCEERKKWMKVNPAYVGDPKEKSSIREKKYKWHPSFNKTEHSFWHNYYMEVYSDTQGYATERMVYNTIKSICKSKSIPVIFLSVPNRKIDIDYDFVVKGYPTNKGHLNSLGHNLLAKDIINHINHENLL